MPSTVARTFSANIIVLPIGKRFPGLTSASQRSCPVGSINKISTATPAGLCPYIRAGMTLVLLKTNKSPACKKVGRS